MSHINTPSSPTTPPLPQVTQNQQQLSTTTPTVNSDPTIKSSTVDSIMERAGLVRGEDGGLTVRDTASIGKTQEVAGLANFEKVYGTGETQLKPVAPPRIELTTELQRGAETFANNMDKVVNDLMVKNGPVNKDIMLDLKNLAGKQTAPKTDTEGVGGIWSIPDDLADTPEVQKLIENYFNVSSTTVDGQIRGINDLTADMLLAAFLKLNITDPNNSVETHVALQKAMSTLRDMAIKEAQAKEAEAAKLREEATEKADNAKYVSTVMTVVRIVVCLVCLVVAVFGLLTGGALTALMIAVAVIVCTATIVEADANNEAAVASCNAAEAGLTGQKAQLLAEKFQEQMKDEGEIMQLIMESKNKIVDAVLRMMNAMFGSAQKLMSAGMAKG